MANLWRLAPAAGLAAVVGPSVAAALGLAFAHVAHLAAAGGGPPAWRRLRFAGLVTAATAVLQGLAVGAVEPWRAAVAASLSLLDVAAVALAVVSFVQVHGGGPRARRPLVLTAVFAAAAFCGLLGGDPGRPLLQRNAAALLLHAAGLALLGAFSLHVHVAWLRGDRRGDEVVARNRLLERLVVAATRLGGLRIVPELQQRIAETAREVFALRRVALFAYSDATGAFEARATAGFDPEATAATAGAQVSRLEFAAMTAPRRRLAHGFLVPESPGGDDPAARPADGGAWPAGARLIVPLVSPAGETRGFLQAEPPPGARLPDAATLRHLEFLARFATAALESAETHERLARNNAELAAASEDLQSLGQMKANFLSNVSHELRTPLTSMLASAEIVRSRGEDLPPARRDEFLATIAGEGAKLSAIIDDLLQLDRMTDRRTRLQRVRTDLVALARRLGETWQRQAGERDIDLAISATAETVCLDVDGVLCEQLLQHLVSNALKFTPAGGRVRLRLAEQGTAARIECEDTGIGIPAAQLDRIFERFTQADDSATREHGGQGVGLAICRDIVSFHDGRIWAENVATGGARFTVLLPRRPAAVIPAAVPSPGPDLGDPRSFLQRVLHWVGEGLGVRLVSLMTPDADGEHLVIRAALGLPAAVVQGTRLRRGAGYAGRVWATGRTLLLADVKDDPLQPDAIDRSHYTTSSLLVVPIRRDDAVVGVVMVNNRLDGRPLDDDDRLLLEALAPRLAHLLARFDAHHDMVREFAGLHEALRATTPVGRLAHTDAAALCREIALATARRLGLPDGELRHLALALQFYDAALGSLPPRFPDRAGALGGGERAGLERSAQASLATLEPLQLPAKARQIILHHHERFDGGGYPAGLAGEAIPLGARLIALADRLRGLLQRRADRPALPLEEALGEIAAGVGTVYCPRLAQPFLTEAAARAAEVRRLDEAADDGEDLKRPAPAHPAALVRG